MTMPNLLPEYRVSVQRQSIKKTNINLTLLNIPEKWRTTKGENIKIGVLDTGLPRHRDLEGKVVMWRNFTNSHTVEDLDGHSTHVCGIIAAESKDKNGLIGIAPHADLVIGKILNDNGAGADEWLAAGIEWCIEQECDIINLSLGAPASMEKKFPLSRAAVKKAYAKNIFMFAASGNDGGNSVAVPARWNEIFCISAIDHNNKRANFSNIGPEVDFSNIGTDVVSTYVGNSYASISGTSQATPGIVGVAALILSEHKQPGHHDTPIRDFKDLRAHLIQLCTDLGDKGYDKVFGWGNPVFGTKSGLAPDDFGGLVPEEQKISWFQKLLNLFRR